MNDIKELLRLPSPAPRPQALACDGATLWMGSLETQRLYAIDIEHWTVGDEVQAPGKPYGIALAGDELRVLCGMPENDDRYIYRFVPGHGFKERLACPEDTGSQLAYDGEFLYVAQWYKRRILKLDETGKVLRDIALHHQICGQVIVDGAFYVLTVEDEKTNDYWLTRVDVLGDRIESKDLLRIPFPARALAFDGERFWTNHRENHEIVAFAKP